MECVFTKNEPLNHAFTCVLYVGRTCYVRFLHHKKKKIGVIFMYRGKAKVEDVA
jgi:hypothetical protein